MNLDFAKVCGKHSAIYEAYYKQIDPNGTGAIEAMTAAKFLKKSGLSDVVLSRVWDMSDPNGKGFLDKPGFFVALKLVSLAQAGQVSNMNNIYIETINPPKVGEIPKIIQSRIQTVPVSSGGVANGDWSISVIDRLKYEQLFESLKPVNGMLAGNKVKGVLMESKLPMDTLGVIWDLADQDKDGNLDKHEFLVAMHLVYQTLQKRTVPNVLPPELRKTGHGAPPPKPAPPNAAAIMPRAPSGDGFGDSGFVANFPKDIGPPAAIPPLPVAVPPMTRIPPVGAVASQPLIQTDPLIPIGAPPSVTANADWVVTPAELQRFEVLFRNSDRDKDGLVSGIEVKDVFIQSGVPQKCLAHIWALCDTNQSGKLTTEQFALAMWMVERKQNGIEPPQVLTSNMVPPSMRGIVSGIDLQPQEPKPTYSNPELEMISKEIEELAHERRALETEIAQKEADVRIKNGEVRSLQSELDTLSATLKQLENQRGEAQKRLDDLQAQGNEFQTMLTNINLEISQTSIQVNKIREQCQKQEETINEQEGELNAKRSELQKLKDEEDSLQKEYDENNHELTKLSKHLQNTQLQISSVRSMVTQLLETQRQMTDALLICRAAIENQNAELVSEYQLKIEPDFDDARTTLEKKVEESKEDPFGGNSKEKRNDVGVVQNHNGFDSDPFGGTQKTITTSGFDDSFNTNIGFDSGFDAFGVQNKDPFGADAFGANKVNAITPEPEKDDFGSDPFAALHAPTGQGQVLSPNVQKSGPPPRPESPTPPNLPPKKSKVPPPRPAPPRPNQGPVRTAPVSVDAFGSTTNSGGFADFADFDNKLSNIPTSRSTSHTPLSGTLTENFDLFDTMPTLSTNVTKTPIQNTLTKTQLALPPPTPPATIATSSSALLASEKQEIIAAINTRNTTANNQISRSNTPMQQIINNTTTTTTTTSNTIISQGFDAFESVTNNEINNISSNSVKTAAGASIISGPTEFKEDPFKDYRYEDPFNIKDPFADDDENVFSEEKMFKDDFSAEVDENKSNNNNKQGIFPLQNTDRTLNNEILEQFDNFNLNTTHKSKTNDNSSSTTGAFADFDSFSTNFSKTTNTNTKQKNNEMNDNKIVENNSFFDAFNDNFDKNEKNISNSNEKNTTKLKQNNTNIMNQFAAFDAFSVATNNKTNDATIFAAFNDNDFGDDFSKTTPPPPQTQNGKNNNINSIFDNPRKKNPNESTTTTLDNFTKFDAFDVHNFSSDFLTDSSSVPNLINEKSPMKLQNKTLNVTPQEQQLTAATELIVGTTAAAAAGAEGFKVSQKFAADYSKPESFDADLEEALKRSVLDN